MRFSRIALTLQRKLPSVSVEDLPIHRENAKFRLKYVACHSQRAVLNVIVSSPLCESVSPVCRTMHIESACKCVVHVSIPGESSEFLNL